MMKKLTAVALALCMLLGLLPTTALAARDEENASASVVVGMPDPQDAEAYAHWKESLYGSSGEADLMEVDQSSRKFYNGFLETWVGSNGQFTMGCTGGNASNPNDDNQMLLYGHPGSTTSETIIRINGTDYRFHSSNVTTNLEDGYSVSVRTIAGVKVTQTLKLVNNPLTNREDIVEIRYTYENTTSETKDVGVRIMLDTMLGYNDGAPFRVGEDQVTYEREYTGSNIPRYWLCFDNFANPNVTSVGTLYTREADKPDKVQFASWPSIFNSSWDYATSENRYMGDTAVAVYYNPRNLAPGETKSSVTYYGISETEITQGILSMRVQTPAVLASAGNGDYENNPFDVTAYVMNTGNTALNNVKISLNLDDTMELAEGSADFTVDKLEPGENNIKTALWTVRAKPQTMETTAHYIVTGDYDGQTAQQVVELETTLDQVAPQTHTVTFQSEGDPIVFTVEHGKGLADSDIPAVPVKPETSTERYEGSWSNVDLSNITQDITVTAVYTTIYKVTGVTLDQTEKTLTIGGEDSFKLTATVAPENASNKAIMWVSYNESVATVDQNGNVTAVNVGTASIAAVSEDDESKFGVCAVTVKAKVTGIEVTPTTLPERVKGDPLDITGLVVKAVLSNGDKKEVFDYTLTGYDPTPSELETKRNEEGQTIQGAASKTETLIISYPNEDAPDAPFTANVTVVVKKGPRTLKAITITRTPNKRLNYVQGDKLDTTGMRVIRSYDDGTTEADSFSSNELLPGYTLTGYNPIQIGNQAVTLSFGGKSTQFSIRVLEAENTQLSENNLLQPRVSVESGLGKKLVTLSLPSGSEMPTGTIYYTTDGSSPTANSTKYDTSKNEPIEVNETTTIKAVQIGSSGKSAITSSIIYLPQAAAPIAANPNHRPDFINDPYEGRRELEAGTLVSLISDTPNASIYYYIDGKLGSAEESKYGTSVYLKPEYADDNGDLTLSCFAMKDGYQVSAETVLYYHLNIPPVQPDTATISVGSITTRAAERFSTTLSINSTGAGDVKTFSVKLKYDSGVMGFVSVNALDPSVQVFAANATDGRKGELTVQYNGANALPTGEVCELNFYAIDSSEDDTYDLTLDESAVVNMTTNKPVVCTYVNGMLSLIGSHNSQLTASTSIVDASGNAITSVDDLNEGDEFQATVAVELPDGMNADELARLQAVGDELSVMNIFLAIYDADHAMVGLECWDIDVTDINNLQSIRRIRIPRKIPGGSVRFMFMSEELAPTAAANNL